jgi:retron-type reverse transcriptase
MTARLNPTVMPADTRSPRPIRIFTRDAFLRTWRNSRDAGSSPGAKGIDGLTARQFGENRDQHLSRMIEDLKRGTYRFADLRPFFLRKKNSKFRAICVPTVADRLVQRVIIDQLIRNDRFRLVNPISFGFVRGRGVQAAIAEAIKHRTHRECVLKTDIQSFFDRIRRADLKDLIKRRLRSHSLIPLLCDAADCEVRAKTQLDRRRLQELGIHGGIGLRQGMPLSPLLSNLVLADFDKAAMARGYDVLRYADDLILFGQTRDELDDGLRFMADELKKVGHTVPPPGAGSKTEFIDPRKPVEFLGVEIVYLEKRACYVCRIPKSVKAAILSDIASVPTLTVGSRFG